MNMLSDTGIGVNLAEIEKIFDDFMLIKSDKTKDISGSGLGLSFIKKLICNYNGTVEVSIIPATVIFLTSVFQLTSHVYKKFTT